MRKLLFILAIILLAHGTAYASYDTATIKAIEPNQAIPGTFRMTVVFSGNAGEPDVVKDTIIEGSATPATIQTWAKARVAELNSIDTAVKNPALQPGRTINLNGGGNPGPTAFQIWQQKAYRLVRLKMLNTKDPKLQADIDALEADVNATYQAGYANQF